MMKFFLRAFAILVVLTIAFPSAGLAHILYYCSMSGRVVSHCCCDPDGKPLTHSEANTHAHKVHENTSNAQNASAKAKIAQQHLKKSPCCFLLSQQKGKNPPIFSPFYLELPIAIQAPQLIDLTEKTPNFYLAALPKLTPPRGPPPPRRLFVKHCSYLI